MGFDSKGAPNAGLHLLVNHMARTRKRGDEIRNFLLQNVTDHPADIAKVAAKKFQISRQAANKHLQRLVEQGDLDHEGTTRTRTYTLRELFTWMQTYELTGELNEDDVWRNDVRPRMGEMPKNVNDIWNYGFTEMLNNAIDHSDGRIVLVHIVRTAADFRIVVADDGVGIFRKVRDALGLEHEREAVLELSKGKVTTDPNHHSGQGIFFSSRAFSSFAILSGAVLFSHDIDKPEDWIQPRSGVDTGTSVHMRLSKTTSRKLKAVFDRFAPPENFSFDRTVVPVRLAQYGDELLVSRSQAKRLLAGLHKFKVVALDFLGVESIGQAFADEVFRVFNIDNPDIELVPLNANKEVEDMVRRAIDG